MIVYLIERGVLEIGVVDEHKAVTGHEASVHLGHAARHQAADDDHDLVRVYRVLVKQAYNRGVKVKT